METYQKSLLFLLGITSLIVETKNDEYVDVLVFTGDNGRILLSRNKDNVREWNVEWSL
jgi:hypothetical protein